MRNKPRVKFKKLYWLLLFLPAVPVIFVLMLLYRPPHFKFEQAPSADYRPEQVSPYLTNELSPQIYNGLQRDEPFDFVVTQDGINDIVARWPWPRESDNIIFKKPAVFFVPDTIILAGTIVIKGLDIAVTIDIAPTLNQQGLLHLNAAKVSFGAIRSTRIAKRIAEKIYRRNFPSIDDLDKTDISARIAESLLDNEPFDPAFLIDDKKVRIKKITISSKKLVVRLEPVLE